MKRKNLLPILLLLMLTGLNDGYRADILSIHQVKIQVGIIPCTVSIDGEFTREEGLKPVETAATFAYTMLERGQGGAS